MLLDVVILIVAFEPSVPLEMLVVQNTVIITQNDFRNFFFFFRKRKKTICMSRTVGVIRREKM